jgi:hypothetical protein
MEEGPSNGRSHGLPDTGRPGASSFMADAQKARQVTASPPPRQLDPGGWQLVSRRKQWRRLSPSSLPPPPQAARCSVLLDLVGRCFNCLQTGHVAAVCPNATRCLWLALP